MKKILVIISSLLIMSCEGRKIRCFVCDKEDKTKISEFITANMKSANNMSDEEMEDVIIQLEKTAIKTFCKQKIIQGDWEGSIDYEVLDKTKKENETYYPYIY